MTNAWMLGASYSIPQDESIVRSTLDPIRSDGAETEAPEAPEFNEFDTDQSGQLTGLSPRGVGSVTIDSQKFVPGWTGLASDIANARTDSQVSSSGTAAKREEAGQQGHGTMQYAIGIEPEIRDGASFGHEHFESEQAVIQEGMGEYMLPTQTDSWGNAVAQAYANGDSRAAFNASQMQAWLEA